MIRIGSCGFWGFCLILLKKILQSLKTGETLLAEVPAPRVLSGGLLIASHASLVSANTERILILVVADCWGKPVTSLIY